MAGLLEPGEGSSSRAALLLHNGRLPIVVDRATPFFRAVMLELERRRAALGITMEEATDRAGLADRYYSKALHSDTPSGRQARWETVQDLLDGLFPEGFDVLIRPKKGLRLDAEQLRCKVKFINAPRDPRSQRELMSFLGKRGGQASAESYRNLPREKRLAIAAKARKTKRKNRLIRARLKRQKAL